MAAEKKKPVRPKQGRKGIRGRVPVKRSINLVLVDENKIALKKAIPGVIIIIILASLFSKYFVADRLIEMSRASGRTAKLRTDLDNAIALSQSFGDIEHTYAHYTYTGMTNEEMSLVDRIMVLDLVKTVLPAGNTQKTWTVSGNILTLEVSGDSLEELNELGRKMEASPIVDSCTITTANKADRRINNKVIDDTEVRAKYIVYLKQPEETEASAAAAENPQTSPEASVTAEMQRESSPFDLKPGDVLVGGTMLETGQTEQSSAFSAEQESEVQLNSSSALRKDQPGDSHPEGLQSEKSLQEGLNTDDSRQEGFPSGEPQSEGQTEETQTEQMTETELAADLSKEMDDAWADAVLASVLAKQTAEKDRQTEETDSRTEKPDNSSGEAVSLSEKANQVSGKADSLTADSSARTETEWEDVTAVPELQSEDDAAGAQANAEAEEVSRP